MAEVVQLREAVAGLVSDGDSVAMEGFTHLIPSAAAHEIIRQEKKDLTLIRMTPDLIYDQMIGMGCARKLIFSWGGNPGVGSLHRFRDAVENGWPRPLELEEHSHAGMANRYVAGASNLPFAVLRGNVAIWGISGIQKEAALSAKRVIVTVEEIVEGFEPRPFQIVLPAVAVDAIAVEPGGSRPSYADGYYDRDNAFYEAWDEVSRDRERFGEWMERHVLGTRDFAEYTKSIEREETLR